MLLAAVCYTVVVFHWNIVHGIIFNNRSVLADILEADEYEPKHKFVYPVSICFE